MNKYILIGLLASCAMACKSPEARKPVTVNKGSFINLSVERNIKLNQKEHEFIEGIIKKDTSNAYIASESGFWYYYNTKVEQDTITANFGDIVNFDYSVTDLSGNQIYSEEEIVPMDYAMDKEELFTGLREGLKLMKPGETVTFFFPSQKAYGYYGDSNRIGTNTPLICKVTVNTITQTQND
ncbi:gliding motility-associated peptidyl-prolyl isomerase GldI [Mangrovimonas sp. DI 80]|uniref:gliding motility-associated peptidyl-prolyl isomerase GldI n=1 Tax=Mangrovimonas sp. DI 80 TaxID=1779330 RepID=UPI00097583C6|nr:gliding motility-associated peptidyl-prolyl isomerase GldI [Mangrovimonas sp. DI 80]OMP30447.1 gliding motility-associated peptidyl-prolyl isomerase GldI [Mangrovimonas sp. DI 80]